MKKRNLFLSLICSVLLTVALVTFTVISIVPKKNKNGAGTPSTNVSDETSTPTTDVTINDDRDGSEEKPFYIYSAESFNTFVVGKYLDSDGNYIDYNAVDEDGELLYPELNAGLYYELYNDIDFSDSKFTTIFNKGVAFNGHIDGKGHALKNISIEVTQENFDSFIYQSSKRLYSAHVGVFGELKNAEIANVSFKNLDVKVGAEVIDYCVKGGLAADRDGDMDDVIIGSVAAIARNTKVSNMTVDASVEGCAYARTANGKVQTFNIMGGVFGLLSGCEVYELNATTNIETVAGLPYRFYVGGAFGYACESKVEELYVDTALKSNYEKQLIFYGGVAGFARTFELQNATVALDVQESGENRFDVKALEGAGVEVIVAENSKSWIAGIVNSIVVTDATTITKIANVKTIAKVDFDGIFAGAVMDVFNYSGLTSGSYVELTDIIVDSDVVALKAYAFARTLKVATINLVATNIAEIQVNADEVKDVEFNVRLTGYIKLKSTTADTVAAIGAVDIDRNTTTFVGGKSSIKVVISSSILSQVSMLEQKGYGVLETI